MSLSHLQRHLSKHILGQDALITEALCTFIAGGHILITGAPGLAKTTFVKTLAEGLSLNFKRIQFTPDLLPSDIIGSEILETDSIRSHKNFRFLKGPVFANFILADEINRASPRTQSALLEAMQEHTVTVGGTSHTLGSPFMVFATQNPFEMEGTFPLPEAQLDRFLCESYISYPDAESEFTILKSKLPSSPSLSKDIMPLKLEEAQTLLQAPFKIHVHDEIIRAISSLIRMTRPDYTECPTSLKSFIYRGAGPRAGISLLLLSRAFAVLENESEVRMHHVSRMLAPVLRPRIKLTSAALRDKVTPDALSEELLKEFYKNSRFGV